MGYSNWRQDLTEVMTDKEDDKKVTERKVKNKIVINPKLGEAVQALGGELIDLVEVAELEQQEKEKEEDKTLANKQKKINMVKKQVLLKKMQAVRQGAGADIVAHYEPEGNIVSEEEKKDHEYHMARSQLKTIKNAVNRLEKKMGKKGEGELKAWVQSKITKASDYIDTAADYVTNEEKKGCVHNHKGEECPIHGKKECPDIVAAEVDEGKGDPCWDSHKQVGMKKKGNRMVPNCVPKNKVKEETEDSQPLQEYGSLVRQGIKVAGKRGGRAVQGGLKSGKSATKNAVQKKEAGSGEKIGKVVGSVVGGAAGAAAAAGDASVGTGIAGGAVGEKVGGAIGKKIDKIRAKKRAKVEEETEDSLRDRRMERGGVDGNNRYKSATKNVAMGGGKKKPYDGMSAIEKVKASIRAKHGQGAIIDTKKK